MAVDVIYMAGNPELFIEDIDKGGLQGNFRMRKTAIDRRKATLDPVFGLAATRDTRAMDSARNRNFSHDKKLQTVLKTIDDDLNTRTVRCLNKLAKEKHFLESINPNPHKKVVCPIGMSIGQKQAFRLLRRSSLPSMTLDEFDEKLSATRSTRTSLRNVDEGKTDIAVKHKLSEFQIKRKLYRRNSKQGIDSQTSDPVVNLVQNGDIAVAYPLYRRKTIVGDVYQRITSADISHSDRGTSQSPHSRSCNDSDIDKDIKCSRGQHRDQLPDIFNRRRGQLSGRRNTMPDITVGLGVQMGHSSRKAEHKQVSSDKHNFQKMLNAMEKKTRMPDIQSDSTVV